MVVTNLGQEKVWVDKASYDKAECLYFEKLAKECRVPTNSDVAASGSLANEVAKARQHIKKGLQYLNNINDDVQSQDLVARVTELEKENREFRAYTQQLNTTINDLRHVVEKLEKMVISSSGKVESISNTCPVKPAAKVAPRREEEKMEEEDDDIDLFGSDSEEENEEAAKIREERLAAYAAKKSKKPALIAKSNIILDVKPWDDETDMKAMEEAVRKITCDGLLWGAAKLVPLAYGIQKLQISCVIEDDKVSVDWLTEEIEKIEDLVQSVDIAAFNKV